MIIKLNLETMKKSTLNEVLATMKWINRQDYDCYFKGKGNGEVKLVMEKR